MASLWFTTGTNRGQMIDALQNCDQKTCRTKTLRSERRESEGKLGTELTNETFGQDPGNVLQDMFSYRRE